MSETIAHTKLVGVMVKWFQEQYFQYQGVCLLCDSPTILCTEKPPPIDGFYSDIYATAPRTLTVLGEAKTVPDLESRRSFEQLCAFLRFLACSPSPQLILATHWQAKATARSIVRIAKLETHAQEVPVTYLTDLDVC